MMPIWGIDLGGTKIEGVVLDNTSDFNVLKRIRVPTEKIYGYDHILNQIIKLIEILAAEVGVRPQKIGMGTPGIIDRMSGTMKNSNTTVLNGQYLKEDLEERLNIPIVIANDANCFAIAETRLGIVSERMPEAEVVFGIIMGTGVGGGVVVNQKVLQGRHGIAGEWGHNFLDESGGYCYCGNTGCIENVISGPALERYYKKLTGHQKKLKTIIELADQKIDPAAIATKERLIHFFGKAVAQIINILDPDAIVIGGGVGNIDQLYTEGVKAATKYVFNSKIDTVFLKPKLGDSAGVFGAAMLTL